MSGQQMVMFHRMSHENLNCVHKQVLNLCQYVGKSYPFIHFTTKKLIARNQIQKPCIHDRLPSKPIMVELIAITSLLFTLITFTHCCRCVNRNQTQNDAIFCSSEFAAIIRITDKSYRCPIGNFDTRNICYPIRIANLLRGQVRPTTLETASSYTECGLTDLYPGVYFVSANYSDSSQTTFQIGSCDLYMDVSDSTIRSEVVRHYKPIKC